MADEKKVRRILHLKFTWPTADPAQLAASLKAMAPFYEMGGMKVRLLQNADDQTKFVQVIDYEANEALENNRQQMASDPRVQAYLQAWRRLVPGAVEVDVYREVEV